MKRQGMPWAIGVTLVVAMLGVAMLVALRDPHPPAAVSTSRRLTERTEQRQPVNVTPSPSADLGADDVRSINALIASTPELRNDVLFLVVASARDRCDPQDAGNLARMANRAQLPVLAGVSTVTEANPALERPLYRYIEAAASAVDCRLQLTLADQPPMEISTYAAGFPDTFHAPGRAAKPSPEYEGLSLAQRAAQPCRSVAYAVLPLGAPQWQCDSTRAGARKRIMALCEAELDRRGVSHEAELYPAIGDALAPTVSEVVATLPANCR